MWDFSVYTDKGGREVNEDTVLCSEKADRACFVLCDGLGGHGMGDEASKLVARRIIEEFENSKNNEKLLEQAFLNAQDGLIKDQIKRHAQKKMKTTAVVLLTDSEYARIGFVGDSRLYIFDKKGIKKRTLDHSVPQMLVYSRQIKEEEIRNHPDRNRLMRVMGIEWDEPMYELLKPEKIKKCRAFLLCSDGFWECIKEEQMEKALAEAESAAEWIEKMLVTVTSGDLKKPSDMDNYSAIAVINRI